MSRVLVWKSDADGKLFEDRSKYVAHLRKLAKARRDEKKIQQCRDQAAEFVRGMHNTVKTVGELEKFITDNWEWFVLNGKSRQWGYSKKKKDSCILESVRFLTMNFSENCSNSHSAPANGVTNWNRQRLLPTGEPAPTGYPGWVGYIYVKLLDNSACVSVSDMFEGTGINTGSGGGGNNDYRYSVTLFSDDFVAMENYRKAKATWDAVVQ